MPLLSFLSKTNKSCNYFYLTTFLRSNYTGNRLCVCNLSVYSNCITNPIFSFHCSRITNVLNTTSFIKIDLYVDSIKGYLNSITSWRYTIPKFDVPKFSRYWKISSRLVCVPINNTLVGDQWWIVCLSVFLLVGILKGWIFRVAIISTNQCWLWKW